MQLTSDLEGVPHEVKAPEILQLIIYSREHSIPVCHRRHDHVIKVFVYKLYLQMLMVSQELADATPAIIVQS